MLEQLRHPIIQAPMAGGASTVAMAAAVSKAGGLGFLASGMQSLKQLKSDLDEVRTLVEGGELFGVNVFCPSTEPGDPAEIAAYAAMIAPIAARSSVELGEPRFHRDRYDEKVALLLADPPPIVSFVFGCPVDEIGAFHAAGAQVWVTVTQIDEAIQAAATGADALIVQGSEAGGHRGGFVDDDREPIPLLGLLGAVRSVVPDTPLIAAGGLMTAQHVRTALARGAAAAQCGTAFLLSSESGIDATHAAGVGADRETTLTRAFTGRLARGLANDWTRLVADQAPRAYPDVMELTAPIRAVGRAQGDPHRINLWAGEHHQLAERRAARQIVERLAGIRDAADGRPGN